MSSLVARVEETPYLKLMLHAAKYPWAAVSGFLLGEYASKEDKVSNFYVALGKVRNRAMFVRLFSLSRSLSLSICMGYRWRDNLTGLRCV